MTQVSSRRRRAAILAATTAAAATAAAFSVVAPTVADASTNTHAYRHGLVPTYQPGARETYNGHNAGPGGGGSKALHYGGGVSGIGVTTGKEQVYLVFWGPTWGTTTGDPSGVAARTQAFFQGIGTNNEGWSRVMADYCEGVATGATTCPSTAAHVAYPTGGGVLAGVWYDTSAVPGTATEAQLVAEANSAASQFGNTTPDSNRNAQYVILSPHGTHPDGFNTSTANWCAWHDYTGDTSLGGTVGTMGPIAFTNDPYLPDAGTSCGKNFVNSGNAGLLDGISIVYGHEYSETITDQFPAGGWTDTTGAENADKCAWLSRGAGAAGNISLSTGSFAVQSTWSNLANNGRGGCVLTK